MLGGFKYHHSSVLLQKEHRPRNGSRIEKETMPWLTSAIM
jgi:hypothetical protein